MSLLGARIRSLREERDLDPGQLAYKADIHVSTVHKIESGERPNTSGIIVAQIADALGTSTDYLLGRTNDPSPILNEAGVSSHLLRIAHEMVGIFQELERTAPDLLDQAVDLIATQTALLVAATENHSQDRPKATGRRASHLAEEEERNQGAHT
jgi:transcriptional regulator with XRE-family HTH domain